LLVVFRCWSILEIPTIRLRDGGIGPREKEQFQAYLNSRLRDERLESLVKSLFRPSYGGNRNYALMYTLARSQAGNNLALVSESPLANSVTSWPN
jgi:hypothetical protein